MPLTLDEYQEQASVTKVYPFVGNNLVYPVLGLVGEAGELANTLKKFVRDTGYTFDARWKVAGFDDRMKLAKELGDILWYISACTDELGFTLDEIANLNLAKLADRKLRDKIQGSGDER